MKLNGHITCTIRKMKIPYDSPVNVMDLYNAILAHCKAEAKAPEKFEWTLVENLLFVDNNLLAIL